MPSFGEKLRYERESRNTPLQDVARRTQIGIQYLEALERNDFDNLPGRRGFGKLYIRAYAEVLGFDPEPLIEAYDREQLRQERPEHAEAGDEPDRPRRIRFVPRPRKSAVTEGEPESPAATVAEAVPVEPEPESPAVTVAEAVPAEPEPESPTATVAEAVPLVWEPDRQPAVEPAPAVSDPQPADELSARRAESAHTVPPAAPAVTSVPTAATARAPSWNRRMAGVLAVPLVFVVLATLGITSRMRTSSQPDAPDPVPVVVGPRIPANEEPPRTVQAETEQVVDVSSGDPASPPATVPQEAPAPRERQPAATVPDVTTARPVDLRPLEVPEFGLGTGVVDRRLVGVTAEFEEGSRASFLTRVRGAAPGQTIRHAWMREGRLVQNIELPLGSSDWRTYSNKTLWGTGNWTVEARDASGAMLARVEFRCVPARH